MARRFAWTPPCLLGALLVLGTFGCAPAPKGPPNILLVSIDTFRADRVGAFGNADGLTPNLDRFAKEATVFSHAYAQSTITGPSHASILTSRYPSEIAGTSRAPSIGKDMYTLPEVLGTYGYQTAARVAGGDLNPLMGPTRGFDSYESSVDFGSLWHTLPMAVDWLDAADPAKPFFLLLHGYDTHSTYLKPTPFGLLTTGVSVLTPAQQATLNATELVLDGKRHANFDLLDGVTKSLLRPRSAEGKARLEELTSHTPRPLPVVPPEDEALIRKVYDGAAAYADVQFGFLLAKLEARGRLDDTVIVVLGDHGEALGEDGLFHRCCSLEDGLTHVPLLVRLPGGEGGGQRVDGVVELVDVMPTLLEFAGATLPAGIKGVSLTPALRGEPFTGRRAALTQGGGGIRMISARSQAGRLTYTGVQAISDVLGDIVTAAQLPGPAFEATEGADAAEQAALRAEMVRWVNSLSPSPLQAAVLLPPELRDTLRAKGYWDAQ
ncbi:MAG: sulfatase [Pseudomonadota bacterium]|nr:sulfatase [Pseudomonadota bacterium]